MKAIDVSLYVKLLSNFYCLYAQTNYADKFGSNKFHLVAYSNSHSLI